MALKASADARDVRRAMARLDPVFREEIAIAMVEGGEDVVRFARQLAPRRLGNLRMFIAYTVDKRTGRGKVGIKAGKIGRGKSLGRKTKNSASQYPSVYGRMVHDGTKYMRGTPFMAMAAEMARRPVQEHYNAAINRAAKRLNSEYRAAGAGTGG